MTKFDSEMFDLKVPGRRHNLKNEDVVKESGKGLLRMNAENSPFRDNLRYFEI